MAPDRDQNEAGGAASDDPWQDDTPLPMDETVPAAPPPPENQPPNTAEAAPPNDIASRKQQPNPPARHDDDAEAPTTPPPSRSHGGRPPAETESDPLDDEPTLTLTPTPKAETPADAGPRDLFDLPDPAAGDDVTRPLGTIAGGKYRILDRLGKGGMGIVYRARDVHLDRDVAVKRINSTELGDEEAVQRFMREARAIARLTHQNIVNIFTLERDDAGPFIVMEHIKGKDAASLIASEGALELEQALNIVKGVGNALAFAHRNAIYHRDVKPSNILIDEDGTPKLVDFGLAKMGRDNALSQTGMGMGTLTYVAPEQLDDASSVDQRADIFSLAKTAYHLFTGERPDAPDLDRLPEELRPSLRKAMQVKPERRHFAISEFLEELDEGSKSALRGDPSLSTATRLGATTGLYQQIACPSCNVNNPMSARFCRACGNGLRTPCPRCNHIEIAGANHCSSCGLNFEGSAKSMQLLDSGREKLEDGLFRAAIEDADRGIALGHDVEHLRELRSRAARLQNQLQDTLEPARSATANNDPETAFIIIKTAHDQAAGPLRAALAHELDAAQRARDDAQIQHALQQAAALEKEGRLFEAVAALKRGYALRPDDTALGSRIATLERTSRERIAQSVRQRTAQLLKTRDFERALAGVDAAIERFGEGPVRAELDKLRERVAVSIVNTRLAEARRAEQATDPETVRAHARGVLAVEPKHREAARLLKAADDLDQAVRVVTTKAHELFDDARPASARDLITEHVPTSESAGPLAALRDQALRRLEQANAHAREAERLLEDRQLKEARAEAEAAISLSREDDATLELRDAIDAATAAASKRRKVLAGGVAVTLVAAVAGAAIGLQAWRAGAIATARSALEDGDIATARAVLASLPNFLRSESVLELLDSIDTRSAARTVEALIERLGRLAQSPSQQGLDETAAIAAGITDRPQEPRPLADALSRAAEAVLIATLDAEPLFETAERLAPVEPSIATIATERALLELLRRAGPTEPPIERARTLAVAARLAARPDYARRAPATANAALNQAAIARAQRLSDVARAITQGTPESAVAIADEAADLFDLDPSLFAETTPNAQGIETLDTLDAIRTTQIARAGFHEALANALAADEATRALNAEADALGAARKGDWNQSAKRFRDAADLFNSAARRTEEQLKRRVSAIERLLERRKITDADDAIEPLVLAAPEDPAIATLARLAADLRTHTLTLPGNVTLELKYVHAPSESIGNTTAATKDFYLAATEITREQFAAVMGGPTPPDPTLPRVNVSYDEAVAFCDALEERLPGGFARLPTAREFAAACRAGGSKARTAWHEGNSNLAARPVATSPTNDLGLHDLLGNAAEWLADDVGHAQPFRTVAGGHFRKTLDFLTCQAVDRVAADASNDTIGFRVLWDPPPSGIPLPNNPPGRTDTPDP